MKRRYAIPFILLCIWAFLNITAATFTNTLDTSTFVNIVLGALAFFSPLLLKKLVPANVKGGAMLAIAIVVSAVLSLIGVAVSGGLALDWHSAEQVGLALAAFMGLQQTFYAALKDALKLNL